ncbi:MAG TPA: Gfo/Idh/MocA family oxidoreductase [Chloroflexota bacterium]|nr:Gfo/Idh/MocA family oxidoreductase [Chloroflexota bacterium]
MTARLRAVVVGAGFAGEGHTLALRHHGVEVVALCARAPEVVRAVADRLEVPEASTNWRETLQRVQPDIVCVATPASVRLEVIAVAAQLGCHLYCDKPLGTNADEARQCFEAVASTGIKHAYAATHRYDPSVAWLAEVLREGVIGQLMEVEGTFRRRVPELTPWSWYDTVATGGGLLHNAFPHWLGILMTATGGEVQRVMGEARVVRQRAPVVPDLHDFRERGARMPSPEEAAEMEWRACDADSAFTALLRFMAAPPVSQQEVHVSLVASGAHATWPPNGWRFHGETGTLLADGHFSYELSLQRKAGGEREPLPVPQRLLEDLPAVGTETQDKWAALARDFLADIRGEPHRPYLTFRDGWRFEAMIDAIRAGRGWMAVPE